MLTGWSDLCGSGRLWLFPTTRLTLL